MDNSRAGLAGGINNAAARAAGLVAVAALPLLAGMGSEAYRSANAFDDAFTRAMPLCAGILVAARSSRSRPCGARLRIAAAPSAGSTGA